MNNLSQFGRNRPIKSEALTIAERDTKIEEMASRGYTVKRIYEYEIERVGYMNYERRLALGSVEPRKKYGEIFERVGV